MLKIRLFPHEFFGLVSYLKTQIDLIEEVPLLQRSIQDQVLLEYWQKARLLNRVPSWRTRNPRQSYLLPIPVSIVRIAHQDMQRAELHTFAQAALTKLDQALINLF